MSSMFDQQDLVAAPAAAPAKSAFEADDLVTPVATKSAFHADDLVEPTLQYEQQRKEVEDAPWYGRWGEPLPTTDQDINTIAEKHGVDSDILKKAAPWFGANVDNGGMKEALQHTAGFAGETVGMGIPQKLYIENQDDPKMQAALDDLRQLASVRKGPYEKGAELVAPGGVIKGGEKFLAKLAAAGITGAVSGAANSRHGEEVKGAAVGAATMGGLIGGLHGLGATIRKGHEFINPELTRELDEAVVKNAPEIERGADKLLEESKISNELAERVVRGEIETVDAIPTAELIKVADEVPEEQLVRLLDPETKRGSIIGKAVYQDDLDIARVARQTDPEKYEENVRAFIGQRRVEEKVKGYARDIGAVPTPEKSMAEALGEYRGQHGDQFAGENFQRYLKGRASLEYLKREHLQTKDPIWRPLRVAQQFFTDFQHVANSVDERLGTNLSKVIRETAEGLNRMTFLKAATDETKKKLVKLTAKAGLTADEITEHLEAHDISHLDPLKREAVEAWRSAITTGDNSLLNLLRRGVPDAGVPGIPVRERDKYVTHMVKAPPEFVATMQSLRDVVQKKFGVDMQMLTQEEYTHLLSDPDMQQLVSGVSWLSNRKPADVKIFRKYLQDATELAPARRSLMTKAGASYERTGEVPDFLREKNILKIWDRYVTGNFRHMFLRKSLDEARRAIPILRKAGDEVTATRIENYVADQAGTRSGTMAALPHNIAEAIKLKAIRKAEQSGNPLSKSFWELTAKSPDMMATMFNNIYANFLGYNARAVIRNISQVPTMVGSQLGGGYGSLSSFQGMAETLLPANRQRLMGKLKELGLEPHQFTGEGSDVIKSGMMETALWKVPAYVLDKQAKAGMYLYSLSDTYNRLATLSVAERMVGHLMDPTHASHNSALNALKRQPTQVRRMVSKAMEMGDGDRALKELASHLISSTQFHYNRAAMSEFGRTMGPIFSTFAKWPTAIAGDVMSRLETEGLVKGSVISARKYLAPLMFASATQHLLFGEPADMNDREQFFVGKNGLAEWTPGWSVTGLSSFMRPAFFDSLGPLLMAPASYVMHQDSDKLATDSYNALSKAGGAFLPGAGLMRFLFMDIPTMSSGNKPESLREQIK